MCDAVLLPSGRGRPCGAVSRHDIAGIWVAFFSRCQRYRCGQVVLTQLQSCCDAHAVSVFERDRYYASPLPLESVRLGLGLAPALAAAPPLPVAGIGAMGGAAATA